MKKVTSLIITLCMLISLIPALPMTVSALTSGTCGDNLTWTLDDEGTLTISGSGEMYDCYDTSDIPWYSSRAKIINVEIEDSVTSIGWYAFESCSSLKNITIPTSVTSIGGAAFWGCSSLASITLPDSVTSIDWCAFDGCSSLASITIPEGVTSIGDYAFGGCSSLTSITIPDSVTSIGDDAFYACSSLTSITIPDSVTSIGDSAFWGCDSLTSIELPDSVTSIGDSVFYGCNSLTSITIPDSVTSIEARAFCDCSSLASITIPDSVTSIGDYAFSYCSGLTSIEIPDSVTSIGRGAFSCCSNLTSITVAEENEIYLSDSNGVLFSKYKTEIIIYPAGKTETNYIIPDSVTSIRDSAFDGCISLASITIPDSVTSVGEDAFGGCISLTSITLPDSVTSIGWYAFGSCISLTSITIPNSVTSIGGYAFNSCSSLASITLPDSVTSIGDSAFWGCDSLTNITIPTSVTSIGDSAFGGCNSLVSINVDKNNPEFTSLDGNLYNKHKTVIIQYAAGKSDMQFVIPSSVTSIGDSAFDGCRNLTSITLPDSVTSIDWCAFDGCSSLTNITIPTSVTSIGYWAFYGCTSLKDVYYKGSETDWDKISIGTLNEDLTNATIHYNYNPTKDIVLSAESLIASLGSKPKIYVYNGDGVTPYGKSVNVTSNNKSVVTTSRKGNVITLNCKSEGSATITVSATDGSGVKKTCKVTVAKAETEETKLLERFALCQVTYSDDARGTSDLVVGKQIGSQPANRGTTMFYLTNGERVYWKDFYKTYISRYKVVKLPSNPKDGFYAAAFESPSGDIIIAYRGSEGENGFLGVFDWFDETEVDWWGAELHMFTGLGLTSQFSQAIDFYDSVKAAYPDKEISLTGHSLGGALASYVSINRGVRCDNVNGATGWLFNNNVFNNPDDYPVNYVGFDKTVYEHFNDHPIVNSNTFVTRFANLNEFNYTMYKDTNQYNKIVEKAWGNGADYKKDYHRISSIINYNNGKFTLTDKKRIFNLSNGFVEVDADRRNYIGTSGNDNLILTGMDRAFDLKWLGILSSPNCYAAGGAGDDSICFMMGGSDTLIGNAGNDVLNGGAGSDTYVFGGNFGNDIIIDPSGKDKIVFTDASLSNLTVSGNKITYGLNSIEISTISKRTADFTIVDKNKNTKTIKFPKVNTYSDMTLNDDESETDTTKGIKIYGNATVEIYASSEELIETITINEDTAEAVEYKDYAMVALSPQVIGLTLPDEGYIVKVKSDETVSVWTVSDADNPTVAKQTFAENRDLSDGSIIVINTGEMVEEQLSVKHITDTVEESIYSEAPEMFTITADKTDIKKGETITMSVPETFAGSVTWECSNNNVMITKNEDLSVSVIGYTPGQETVRAYLPNDELYSAEFTFEITEDAAPTVVVTSSDEAYDGTEIATDSVFFDVTPTDGYDTVVFSANSSYSQIDDTNTFVVNSVGVNNINIYCEDTETGARTESFTFEFSQDSEAPAIDGAENEAVYYTDRVIAVSDTSLETVYVNDELCEEEEIVLSEVGTYTVKATDTAGNETIISFEIKAMPDADSIRMKDAELVSKIRNNFEEIKYSIDETRMNEMESKLSAMEEVLYTLVEITEFTVEKTETEAEISVNISNVPDDAVVFVASYSHGNKLLEIKEIVLADGIGSETFSVNDVSEFRTFVWGTESGIKPNCATGITDFGPAEDILYGDVDADGEVSANDVRTLREVISGTLELTDYISLVGDVNCDGILNETDADLIFSYIMGLIDELPVK